LENTAKSFFFSTIHGTIIHGGVQLHGNGQESLQQCVMEFLRDARAFREPLFVDSIKILGRTAKGIIVEPRANSMFATHPHKTACESRCLGSILRIHLAVKIHGNPPYCE
jgi:hypothetical protein